jgi:hypothetical protein
MTTFLNFHAFAAARGEGLHPKLRLSDRSDLAAVRHPGAVQIVSMCLRAGRLGCKPSRLPFPAGRSIGGFIATLKVAS